MEYEGIGGLLAFVLGWLLAQTGKLIGDMISVRRPLTFKEVVDCFVRSGGMPSGHTASFVALITFFAIKNGLFANITVLALAMGIIVIYDAVNVRYAVGEQGKMLNVMAMDGKLKKKLKVVEGHTVPQAIVGGLIGLMIGIITGCVL
ncbi:MAG: divergent PAP2 family protein [Candidatus Saccharibacteria bacterium]|nr:divergent PAP2 family protein [Candidatus Saccharibacteria bacterium]